MVAGACGVFVAAMVGMAYASVPFYNWFCRTTGFAGTPQVASTGPGRTLDRKLEIRFDANVTGGLPWRFAPEQNAIDVRIGQVVTVMFTAINESARETVGQASYNRAAVYGRRILLQDQLLLLHRAAAEARRAARDAGGVLRRSDAG
jgi:cytochrome c oxidase assembly protein subunit 11